MIRPTLMISAVCLVGAMAVPAAAAPQWNDVAVPAGDTMTCGGGAVPLGTATVGWFGDPAAPPSTGSVFYLRVRWSVAPNANPCTGGARVAPELFLPAGSSPAISATNPVYCYATNGAGVLVPETTLCPQAAQVGARQGLGFYPVGQATWPTVSGSGWELRIPVVATASLSGVVTTSDPFQPCPSCATAAVFFIDGVWSPWAYPRVGVKAVAGATVPTITYPAGATDFVNDTAARKSVSLDRAGTTGTFIVEHGATPPSGSTCVQTSQNSVAVTAQQATPWTFPIDFSAIDPGTTVYWRACYLSGGVTYWGVTQSFHTTGVGPPTIIGLSKSFTVAGAPITIHGSNLGSPTLTYTQFGNTMTITPTSASATAITFTAPWFSFPTSGVLKVTTAKGNATAPFAVDLDTYLDNITTGDLDGDGLDDDVRITFHASEPYPFYESDCQLQGAQMAGSCPAGTVSYYDLSPGPHAVTVWTRSAGTYDGTPLVAAFNITGADTTPPDTSFTIAPAWAPWWLAPSTTVTFAMASTELNNRFQCSVDGGRWLRCGSPYSLTGLALGRHRFEARAIDDANNIDPTPASMDFTVAPLLVWFTGGPPASTTATSAGFTYGGQNVTRFECSLDGGPYRRCQMVYGLAVGAHWMSLRGFDLAGNESDPVAWSWTVTP